MNDEKKILSELAPTRPTNGEIVRNVAFIAVTIGVAYWLSVSVGIENIRDTVETFGLWGPLAIVFFKMTTILVVPLGGGPVYAVAGAVFGFWKGFALTALGDILGFSLAFYISRIFGRSVLLFFLTRMHMPMVENVIARGGEAKVFLKARLAFLGLPEVFAYAAGLTSVRYPLFIVAQMIPHFAASTLLVLFGETLFSGNPALVIFAGVAALIAAIIGGYWLHKDFLRSA